MGEEPEETKKDLYPEHMIVELTYAKEIKAKKSTSNENGEDSENADTDEQTETLTVQERLYLGATFAFNIQKQIKKMQQLSATEPDTEDFCKKMRGLGARLHSENPRKPAIVVKNESGEVVSISHYERGEKANLSEEECFELTFKPGTEMVIEAKKTNVTRNVSLSEEELIDLNKAKKSIPPMEEVINGLLGINPPS